MLRRHLFAILALAASVSCGNIQISVWESEDCTGDHTLRPQLDLRLHVGCIKRGDVTEQLEVELLEGKQREEKAISVSQDGSMAAQSQALVFFTSENCDPSTEIEDAYVDNSCSNVFEKLKEDKWKSYEMRDACFGGFAGCDLDEEPTDGDEVNCERPLLPGWPGCGEPLNPGK
ncbi:hypothetical protein BU26DRAFT_565946 [Trematosphaeria pertusa]|uniref:Uncharacterized protein n=1 Tax=Trematosphaeria pertusa TaxID=390896 RepID=A0A6A6IF87_9PLEO|nr:uncharacterized protein BU26DRAFT_565946 [Trematosphaeria pertusa]KAF2248562.1 hypothetical protein BU26DRAFT_565946 [Trematosphaeria pertusa]